MGEFMLPTTFLKYYAGIAILFAVAFTIIPIFKKDITSDIKETWFSGFKFVGYGLLGVMIYSHYIELDKIPILDFFTFTLAVLEGSHNFVNSLGISIVAGLKCFFKSY